MLWGKPLDMSYKIKVRLSTVWSTWHVHKCFHVVLCLPGLLALTALQEAGGYQGAAGQPGRSQQEEAPCLPPLHKQPQVSLQKGWNSLETEPMPPPSQQMPFGTLQGHTLFWSPPSPSLALQPKVQRRGCDTVCFKPLQRHPTLGATRLPIEQACGSVPLTSSWQREYSFQVSCSSSSPCGKTVSRLRWSLEPQLIKFARGKKRLPFILLGFFQ